MQELAQRVSELQDEGMLPAGGGVTAAQIDVGGANIDAPLGDDAGGKKEAGSMGRGGKSTDIESSRRELGEASCGSIAGRKQGEEDVPSGGSASIAAETETQHSSAGEAQNLVKESDVKRARLALEKECHEAVEGAGAKGRCAEVRVLDCAPRLPTSSVISISAKKGLSASLTLEPADVEKLIEVAMDMTRLIRVPPVIASTENFAGMRYAFAPAVVVRTLADIAHDCEQLSRWMTGAWVRDWDGWIETQDSLAEADGSAAMEALAAKECVRKFARTWIETVRIEAKKDEDRRAELSRDGWRIGHGLLFATNASCADALLQQLSETGFVGSCFQKGTSEGIASRKAACIGARRFLNTRDNHHFHTVLVDAGGKVVNATVEDHHAAAFEPTAHAEGIVKYFLKKYGRTTAMAKTGFTLQVFTRYDAQENDPAKRALKFGRDHEATSPPVILRLYLRTGNDCQGDVYDPMFYEQQTREPEPCSRANAKTQATLGQAAVSSECPPVPCPHPEAAARKRRRVKGSDSELRGAEAGAAAGVVEGKVREPIEPPDLGVKDYFLLRCSAQSMDPRREHENALEGLADALRVLPTLPASETNSDQHDNLATSEIEAAVLPVKHCAFKGCKESFATDTALVQHLMQSTEHMKYIGAVGERMVLPKADSKLHDEREKDLGALRVMSAYNEGIGVAVRRGAPLAALSIDRRSLFNYSLEFCCKFNLLVLRTEIPIRAWTPRERDYVDANSASGGERRQQGRRVLLGSAKQK